MPDLSRFLAAQDPVYATVAAELAVGRKATHWMWFIFPQLAGLGRSATARFYGIAGHAEAAAYLAHPLLGARLRECTRLMLTHPALSAEAILGPVDALKFRSCLTLFAAVAPGEPLFPAALARFYPEGADPATLGLLG